MSGFETKESKTHTFNKTTVQLKDKITGAKRRI